MVNSHLNKKSLLFKLSFYVFALIMKLFYCFAQVDISHNWCTWHKTSFHYKLPENVSFKSVSHMQISYATSLSSHKMLRVIKQWSAMSFIGYSCSFENSVARQVWWTNSLRDRGFSNLLWVCLMPVWVCKSYYYCRSHSRSSHPIGQSWSGKTSTDYPIVPHKSQIK